MQLLHVRPVPTGRIAENLYAIRTGTVNFYVCVGSGGAICFDSGFGKRRIAKQLRGIGIRAESVKYVFLTHSDFDHAGGLKLFKNAKVFLSSDEEQMNTGKKARIGIFRNSRIHGDYTLLRDGDTVCAGGAEVRAIATPGHTPGSMCYAVNGSMLFSGDAFKLSDGNIEALRNYINMDTDTQKKSIKKLGSMELAVKIACTGHWGYTNDFSGAISGWRRKH